MRRYDHFDAQGQTRLRANLKKRKSTWKRREERGESVSAFNLEAKDVGRIDMQQQQQQQPGNH